MLNGKLSTLILVSMVSARAEKIGDSDSQVSVSDRIVKHAASRFFEFGFSRVTMEELAGDLGISKKTMYRYFDSKDDLLDRVLEIRREEMRCEIQSIINSHGDYLERVQRLFLCAAKRLSLYKNVFYDDLRKYRPDLWLRIQKDRKERILRDFERLIEEGVSNGSLRSGLRADLITRMYAAAVESMINPDALLAGDYTAKEAYESIFQVFFTGLMTDAARKKIRNQKEMFQ